MELIREGYERVTEILSIFQAYAFVPQEKLKKAQDAGTEVHGAIEEYFNGSFPVVRLALNGYMESFHKFVSGVHLVPSVIEKRMYSERLRVSGRIDLVAEVDGITTIIDFKTGSWAHPEIWRLQGTFYRHLLECDCKELASLPDRFVFVQLQKDGAAPILFDMEYRPSDMEICEFACKLYHYFKKCPPVTAVGHTDKKGRS